MQCMWFKSARWWLWGWGVFSLCLYGNSTGGVHRHIGRATRDRITGQVDSAERCVCQLVCRRQQRKPAKLFFLRVSKDRLHLCHQGAYEVYTTSGLTPDQAGEVAFEPVTGTLSCKQHCCSDLHSGPGPSDHSRRPPLPSSLDLGHFPTGPSLWVSLSALPQQLALIFCVHPGSPSPWALIAGSMQKGGQAHD